MKSHITGTTFDAVQLSSSENKNSYQRNKSTDRTANHGKNIEANETGNNSVILLRKRLCKSNIKQSYNPQTTKGSGKENDNETHQDPFFVRYLQTRTLMINL
jgi:phosphoribosylanthranilate isomerase